MKSGRPPRFAVALLARCVPDNEPLTGDLLEEWRERSDAWFWRQVLLAVLARAILSIRTNPRTTTEAVLLAAAMLALLGFQAVVVASLMNHLLVLNGTAWIPRTGRYQEWQLYSTVPSFVVAMLTGRVIGRVHRDHRVAAALGWSASATAAAFMNLYLFVPDVLLQPFVPDVALQTAVAMVFISGLFAGIVSRSICEPLPSA
jgi:hypothetical protein